MVYSNKTVVFYRVLTPASSEVAKETGQTKRFRHRKILTFDEDFFCVFQPKLQFLAFSITGKQTFVQNDFTFSS
jgi:hypothetical protein